jgi:hypothetical protein
MRSLAPLMKPVGGHIVARLHLRSEPLDAPKDFQSIQIGCPVTFENKRTDAAISNSA